MGEGHSHWAPGKLLERMRIKQEQPPNPRLHKVTVWDMELRRCSFLHPTSLFVLPESPEMGLQLLPDNLTRKSVGTSDSVSPSEPRSSPP